MARSKKPSTSPAPILDAAFWAQFGLDEHSNTREKLLYLALAEISRRGILDVNARWLTDSIAADPSAINYHFGSFDGLIAEVFVVAHDIWVDSVRTAVAVPVESIDERIRLVLNAQVERAQRFGAVIGVAHLPHVSEQVESILTEQFPNRISGAVAYVVTVMSHLIADVWHGTLTPVQFGPEDAPVMESLQSRPNEVAAAIYLQWSVVGPTLWMTGKGGGVRELSEMPAPYTAEMLWPGFVDRAIAQIQNDPNRPTDR